MSDACPCGSNAEYLSCCGRYLDNKQIPDSAEQLMRSRYCAYVRARPDYLLATWHASTRPQALSLDVTGQQWLGLTVIRAHKDAVEFVARYKLNGKAFRLHEVSRFVNEQGRWMYLDGDIKH